MSTSQESGLSQTSTKALTHFPGLVHNQPDVLPEALKILRGISELTASVDAALTPFFEEVVAVLNSVEKNLAAAPEVPGHEALLVEWFGYGPLWARLVTRLIHRRGELLADEINEGRRVRAIIDQIAKAKGRNALVTSRRAERFRDECNSLEARDLIDEASQKAGLMTTAAEFNQLAEGACARDEAACLDLGQMAEQLAPHLPEKRGRPISPETCIHIFLQRHLESLGIKRAYTYSETDSNDDFVDQVTQATRLAMNNPRFSPLHANLLRKSERLPPPMRIRDSAVTKSAAPPARRKSALKLSLIGSDGKN